MGTYYKKTKKKSFKNSDFGKGVEQRSFSTHII